MKLHENLAADSVSHLGRSALVTVPPAATVRDAVSLMRRHRSGCALICQDELLLGIFTERDFLKRVLAAGADPGERIDAFMTRAPLTIRATDSVGQVLRRMLKGGYRHLPIVDEGGRVLGVVSVKGLIHYLVEHFPTTVYNLPPVPEQVHQSREGA